MCGIGGREGEGGRASGTRVKVVDIPTLSCLPTTGFSNIRQIKTRRKTTLTECRPKSVARRTCCREVRRPSNKNVVATTVGTHLRLPGQVEHRQYSRGGWISAGHEHFSKQNKKEPVVSGGRADGVRMNDNDDAQYEK